MSLAGLVLALVVGCGETRRPIGDECLRDEDCLSSTCSARACVAAPALVVGPGGPPEDEQPRLPEDAGTPSDSGGGG